MTMTENETEHRRLVVRRQPVDGEPPWRAILDEPAPYHGPTAIFVGRFETHAEAIRTGCTALRFVSAGIPWRVTP